MRVQAAIEKPLAALTGLELSLPKSIALALGRLERRDSLTSSRVDQAMRSSEAQAPIGHKGVLVTTAPVAMLPSPIPRAPPRIRASDGGRQVPSAHRHTLR